jgi:lysophospholipase L1-like esterase
MRRVLLSVLVPFFALAVSAQQKATDAERWAKYEKEISAIEKRLKEMPPAPNPVVFIGSSTIRLWDLEKSFPGKGYVNLGFGGSQVRDSTHFAPRLIAPLKPKVVVFYAGDNDVASGRTAEQVRDDTRAFLAEVHRLAPEARVVILGIKPSVRRWEQFATQTKANAYVKELCEADPKAIFIDLAPPMLGPDGTMPSADLFIADGLHLSAKGYGIAAGLLEKVLE